MFYKGDKMVKIILIQTVKMDSRLNLLSDKLLNPNSNIRSLIISKNTKGI